MNKTKTHEYAIQISRGLQRLKYLPFGPVQKTFADSWSEFKEYFLDLVPDIGNLGSDTYNDNSD